MITAGKSVEVLARSASRSSKELNSPRTSPMKHGTCFPWAALRLCSPRRAWPPRPTLDRYRLFGSAGRGSGRDPVAGAMARAIALT